MNNLPIQPHQTRELAATHFSPSATGSAPNQLLMFAIENNWSPEIQANLKETLESSSLLDISNKTAAIVNKAFADIKNESTVESVHQRASEAIQDLKQLIQNLPVESAESELKLIGILENRIMFEVGSKSVDILFHTNPIMNDIIKKFYRDESHPMDLQRLLRHPDLSNNIGNILNNLINLTDSSPEQINKILGASNTDFNQFLSDYIQTSFPPNAGSNPTSLIQVAQIEPKLAELRAAQTEYYAQLEIGSASVVSELTFATEESQSAIVLLDANTNIPLMPQDTMFFSDNTHTYLRVPEAERRIVRISNKGFEHLQAISKQNAKDLVTVTDRISSMFKAEGHIVSSRTKSAKSLLDKCGRLSSMTQAKDMPKYRSTLDIIDVNGARITCADSRQIIGVIEKLKAEGFEFYELDNKYANIRKDGAYKVVPCTIRDPLTGVMLELQITTLSSTAVTDLFHNVIYKREAIGLQPTDRQSDSVLKAQRMSALIETMNLKDSYISLTKNLGKTSLTKSTEHIENAYISVIQYRENKTL